MRIKNWAKFQHFKDRRPPWIKLYRDLLDDVEWHELDAEAAKVLVMLWVIASEDEGRLPEMKKLAFRLRMTEKQVISIVSKLDHWLEQDDIDEISPRCQDDTPETETETETEKKDTPDGFDQFWDLYKRKEAKGRAVKALKSATRTIPIETILDGLRRFKWPDDPKYVPLPATWLNDRRWEDCAATVATTATPPPDEVRRAREERIAWALKHGIINNLDATPAEISALVSAGRVTEDQARKAGWAA